MKIEILNQTIELSGIIIGSWIFIIIIIARKLCIWGEYQFTKKFWIFFFTTGILSTIFSIFVKNTIFSIMLSSAGFIFLWGIHETIEQEQRVKKGWFPKKEKNK
jgi:hypothetical protein